MGKIIAVASGKGGTGKTTTVAAVSSCLAALGHKTLCVDFDSGLRNLDLSLCMADFTIADYMDVVSSRIGLMEACHECPQIANLFFLAAPNADADDDRGCVDVTPMFEDIRREFDFCLIDSPSGIGEGFRRAHTDADMSIIVTHGELPAMRDAQKTVMTVRDAGVRDVRLLVNRVVPKNLKWLQTTVDDVIDTVGAQLIGVIPEDSTVFRALHDNVPLVLHKKRRAAYDFLDVARRIAGEAVPMRMR